jgi:hypothetical protein
MNSAPIPSAKVGNQELVRYDAACRALAEARQVDEVKDIRDVAVAMAAYARQAKNRELEADAVEIRMRATRKLDQLRQAQKETVGLASGGDAIKVARGIQNPEQRPTLESQGIDKNLAKQVRALGALSPERFEQAVVDARSATARAFRNVVNAAIIEQERESYRARTEHGASVADLKALVSTGKDSASSTRTHPGRSRSIRARESNAPPNGATTHGRLSVSKLCQCKRWPLTTAPCCCGPCGPS